VHAFCRDVDKLEDKDKAPCTQGDAVSPKELERAFAETRAEVVALCIGSGNSVKRATIALLQPTK
jgi:hypothetical protein